MLNRLVNFFIPAHISGQKDDMRSERIFVAVLLISAFSNLLGISLAAEIQIPVVGPLLFLAAAVNILMLFIYKYGLPRIIAAHITLGLQSVSLMIQAYYQGGLMTPAVAAFFLIPALAMLIIGKRGAIVWLIVTVLMTVTYLLWEQYIGPIESTYLPEKHNTFVFSSLLGVNITIFFILLVYENSKNLALKNVQKKHADLVAAQSQLIQSAKMASLGELTAGIAHEIQNPLNFVNNFSEVSNELMVEMKEELTAGDIQEAIEIAEDIRQNLEKINHHGKRAESIIKGMLLHSRGNSGQKEIIDINELCDEYLRLSFHGFRAKDKSFTADFKLEIDKSLPKMNVVPQDLGRVFLNLLNNAFYAVNEKVKQNVNSYKPLVVVQTKKNKNGIEIRINDNGPGIPENIREKIFQPFYTTKPTGQGTGLGLSLSYDIIKAHGGDLSIETLKNDFDAETKVGTAFVIKLPFSKITPG